RVLERDLYIGNTQAPRGCTRIRGRRNAWRAMDVAVRLQIAAAAPAREHMPGPLQARERGVVRRGTAALEQHRLVRNHAERRQRIENVLRGAGNLARRIEVFHADEPDAALAAGTQPAAECRDERTEMQLSGRRGRETAAIVHW